MEAEMLHKTQMPEIPAYVAHNMQKIAETGMDDLNLREIGRLLIDWENKYWESHGYKNCRETVEWLSENYEYFEEVKNSFVLSNKPQA